MKILGLIGGTSWISTVDYYRFINQGINEKLGGLHFARCIIYSFNYADIKKNNDKNDWDSTFRMVTEAGKHLKNSGAEGLILCANTMHLIAERVEEAVQLPVIHIATATALAIQQVNLTKVGLLGTKFTMERDFFRNKLTEHGIESLIPDEAEREYIHETLHDELGKGIIKEKTRMNYLKIIDSLIEKGAEGVILGCTEIPLLLNQEMIPVPAFDTTFIHSQAAVAFALGLVD